MSVDSASRLQGIHDILPPPMLEEASRTNATLLIIFAILSGIAIFTWCRLRNTKLQLCRREFRKLSRNLPCLDTAQAAEILGSILQKHFNLPHLDTCPEILMPSLGSEDWHKLVSQIYHARFSGKTGTDLQAAMHTVQQILWGTRV